jgi:hypothetical protein
MSLPPSPVRPHPSPSARIVLTSRTDEPNAPYPERFVVQSLLLLKATMGDWASASPVDVSPDFVRQFAGLIVTRLLPLRPVDLEKWGDDPEEWMNEEEADRWEYELRVSPDLQSSSRYLLTRIGSVSPARSTCYSRY